jgi:LysR family hydrogen peroxide-inducible transcriptional activator
VPLFDEELLLIAPADREADMPRDIGKLDPEELLLLEEGHCLRGHTLAGCGWTEPRLPRHGGDQPFHAGADGRRRAGNGAAARHDFAFRPDFAHETGVAHRFSEPRPHRTIALVARSSNARRECFDRIGELIAAQARIPSSASTDGTGA